MNDTPSPTTSEAAWYTPTLVMRLADGSTMLKPGKPVQRATSSQVAKWTGISKKNLRQLAEIGLIREARPTPWSLHYYPAEVEEFIAKTEADPDFWNKVRKDAYIQSRRLRDSRFKPGSDAAGEELPGI